MSIAKLNSAFYLNSQVRGHGDGVNSQSPQQANVTRSKFCKHWNRILKGRSPATVKNARCPEYRYNRLLRQRGE